jgi:periplasmic divalent cation tolerance protein
VADCCQVTTTVATQADAERIAAALVGERLAACVQIVGPIASIYRWQGAVERADEWYCHCKTTRERYPALELRIRQLHPYEIPEIIAVPIMAALPAYLAWIEDCVR